MKTYLYAFVLLAVLGSLTYAGRVLWQAGYDSAQTDNQQAVIQAQQDAQAAQQKADDKTIADLRTAIQKEKDAAAQHAKREQTLASEKTALQEKLHALALKDKAAADWLPVVIPPAVTDGLCWSRDCASADRQDHGNPVHSDSGG